MAKRLVIMLQLIGMMSIVSTGNSSPFSSITTLVAGLTIQDEIGNLTRKWRSTKKKERKKEKKGEIIESETSNVVVMGVLLDTRNRVNRLDPRPWYHYAIV